uniref:DUF727 domain-containing protein n=1 Tax=Panagrellus redivivus TaxID=6233 RepID=A0A7E5A1I9_PANRE
MLLNKKVSVWIVPLLNLNFNFHLPIIKLLAMGSNNSTSNSSNDPNVGKRVNDVLSSLTDLIKKVSLGDIIQFSNGLCGIVTSLTNSACTVATTVGGVVQEIDINQTGCEKARIYNKFDYESEPYNWNKVVKLARESIGNYENSLDFAKRCRNGLN